MKHGLRIPPEVYHKLFGTAQLAHVPVEEVVASAFLHFRKLPLDWQRLLVQDFRYRGRHEKEGRGTRVPRQPWPYIRMEWQSTKERWRVRDLPKPKANGLWNRGQRLVRAILASVARWFNRSC